MQSVLCSISLLADVQTPHPAVKACFSFSESPADTVGTVGVSSLRKKAAESSQGVLADWLWIGFLPSK